MNKHLVHYNTKGKQRARKLRKAMTDAERKLWRHLRYDQLRVRIRRQVPIGQYILDFYCDKAKLCIEIDGSQHYETNGIEHDKIRDNFLNSLGIRTLRFTNYEVISNIQGVLSTINDAISGED